MNEDLRYLIALMNIKGVGSAITRHLIHELGSAKAVFETEDSMLRSMGRIGELIFTGKHDQHIFDKADSELDFIDKHHIKGLVYGQEGYPTRLLDCPDAPAILFSLGNANLNSKHIISIVGTRSSTQYGRDCVNGFVEGISNAIPDALIVSGLALGIDISAHKAALENSLPTVGVVAHGLDTIYPYVHRNIAKQMLENGGGLLTEYTSGTTPERGNFLARNRIIAGLADAIIVAESRDKGGSLVTASIALDYNRDVYAFPGRTCDDRSSGCNRLIRLNRAGLITNAENFLEAMSWGKLQKHAATQQSINFEEGNISEAGHQILDLLLNMGDLRLDNLCNALTKLSRATIQEELLDLELKDKIRTCRGGIYQIK